MKNIGLKFRLIAAIGFLTLLLIGVGLLGYKGLVDGERGLETTYADQVLPLIRLIETLTNDIATPASTQLSNALGSAGSFVFHVGGTVPVAVGGPTGTLTGTYSVSVDYN